VDAAASEMRDNWFPSTRYLGRIAQASERLRLDQNIAATTKSNERRALMAIGGAQQIKLVDAALADYQPVARLGTQQTMSAAILQFWTQYKATSERFGALLSQGDSPPHISSWSLIWLRTVRVG